MREWMNPSRGHLALWWASFVLLWCAAVVVLVGPVNYLACNAENLELADGSARESYCEGVRDFLKSGEPSELTTPLPYLLPVAVLAAVGIFGIGLRSKRFVRRAAIVAVAALLAHVALLIVLPG
jgi:hypothetical protein